MCNTTNISALGPFRVDSCGCGSIHVHLGPAMVRLTPDWIQHLAAVIALANERLQDQPSHTMPPTSSDRFRNN